MHTSLIYGSDLPDENQFGYVCSENRLEGVIEPENHFSKRSRFSVNEDIH